MADILVTGATGNVGKYVCEFLDSAKISFIAASTRDEKSTFSHGRWVRFDFTDPRTFSFSNFETVFLMRPPQLANIERDMVPSLQWFKKIGVQHIVVMSLLGAQKMSFVPHRKLELAVAGLGFSYSFIRPGFFMQNLTGIHAKEIKERGEIVIPSGKTRFSFVDAKDIAEASTACLRWPSQHRNQKYDITGREALDYYGIGEILSKKLHKKIVYCEPSIVRFVYLMRRRRLPWSYIMVMVGLYTASRFGTPYAVSPDFKSITGHEPIRFDEFADREVAAWQ